jgi:hypothetical protein
MFKSTSVTAVLLVILTATSIAQPKKRSASLSSAGTGALAYFDQIHGLTFDIFLKSIRPEQLSPESKAKLIGIFPKRDIVRPSAQAGDKLAAVEPVLKYYGRSSVIDLMVIRMCQAIVRFLAGAAVVISQEALELFTAKELQAIIAHELGHEYFWNEWQQARLNKQYEKIQEIELRCDGMAVITMNQLGLDPSQFISAITKLTKSHRGPLANAAYYPPLEERITFIHTMIEMVKARGEVFGRVASKG